MWHYAPTTMTMLVTYAPEYLMQPHEPLSRRNFVTTTSLLAGGLLATSAAATEEVPLALDGGPKAVTISPPKRLRWGEPDREQLEAMLEQQSLMYWKGPQTAQMIECFQQFCPLEDM